MPLNTPMLNELPHEIKYTRRMLERVPAEHFGWKPHEKSMSLQRLAEHVAYLLGWFEIVLKNDAFDFGTGKPFPPADVKNTADIVALFDRTSALALELLKDADDDYLRAPWQLLNNGKVVFEMPRIGALRGTVVNHLIHHRGQLSVYFRLLNQSVPAVYGPSADEMN